MTEGAGSWWDEVETADGKLVVRVRAADDGVRVVLEGAGAVADVLLPRDSAAALAAALAVVAGSIEEPGSGSTGVAPGQVPRGPHEELVEADAEPGPEASRPWTGPRPGLPESLAVRRQALDRIRAVCSSLPETVEIEALGSPTFRVATRTFAVVESDDGLPVLRVKVRADQQARLLGDSRYRADVETGVHGWTSLRLDLAGDVELHDLVVAGYRNVAPDHLVAALGGTVAPPAGD
jgi:hypothetical protein